MIHINPDPHTGGYAYAPNRAVTAFFPVGVSPQPALRALYDAGFADDQVQVFSGPQGAEVLDAEGRHHGLWVRFMRLSAENATDDYYMFTRADEILKAGGTVVAAFTLKDEEKKRRAVKILMANRGEDVMYWGPWIRESYSLGSTPVEAGPAAEVRSVVERVALREDECAADYRRLADLADAPGLAKFGDRLKRLAADHAGHADEMRRILQDM